MPKFADHQKPDSCGLYQSGISPKACFKTKGVFVKLQSAPSEYALIRISKNKKVALYSDFGILKTCAL